MSRDGSQHTAVKFGLRLAWFVPLIAIVAIYGFSGVGFYLQGCDVKNIVVRDRYLAIPWDIPHAIVAVVWLYVISGTCWGFLACKGHVIYTVLFTTSVTGIRIYLSLRNTPFAIVLLYLQGAVILDVVVNTVVGFPSYTGVKRYQAVYLFGLPYLFTLLTLPVYDSFMVPSVLTGDWKLQIGLRIIAHPVLWAVLVGFVRKMVTYWKLPYYLCQAPLIITMVLKFSLGRVLSSSMDSISSVVVVSAAISLSSIAFDVTVFAKHYWADVLLTAVKRKIPKVGGRNKSSKQLKGSSPAAAGTGSGGGEHCPASPSTGDPLVPQKAVWDGVHSGDSSSSSSSSRSSIPTAVSGHPNWLHKVAKPGEDGSPNSVVVQSNNNTSRTYRLGDSWGIIADYQPQDLRKQGGVNSNKQIQSIGIMQQMGATVKQRPSLPPVPQLPYMSDSPALLDQKDTAQPTTPPTTTTTSTTPPTTTPNTSSKDVSNLKWSKLNYHEEERKRLTRSIFSLSMGPTNKISKFVNASVSPMPDCDITTKESEERAAHIHKQPHHHNRKTSLLDKQRSSRSLFSQVHHGSRTSSCVSPSAVVMGYTISSSVTASSPQSKGHKANGNVELEPDTDHTLSGHLLFGSRVTYNKNQYKVSSDHSLPNGNSMEMQQQQHAEGITYVHSSTNSSTTSTTTPPPNDYQQHEHPHHLPSLPFPGANNSNDNNNSPKSSTSSITSENVKEESTYNNNNLKQAQHPATPPPTCTVRVHTNEASNCEAEQQRTFTEEEEDGVVPTNADKHPAEDGPQHPHPTVSSNINYRCRNSFPWRQLGTYEELAGGKGRCYIMGRTVEFNDSMTKVVRMHCVNIVIERCFELATIILTTFAWVLQASFPFYYSEIGGHPLPQTMMNAPDMYAPPPRGTLREETWNQILAIFWIQLGFEVLGDLISYTIEMRILNLPISRSWHEAKRIIPLCLFGFLLVGLVTGPRVMLSLNGLANSQVFSPASCVRADHVGI